jgi:uncharacterized HAD superfamily protein
MVIFCEILNKRHSSHFTLQSFNEWNAWRTAHITKNEFFRTLDEAWLNWKEIPELEIRIGEKVKRIEAFGQVDIVTGRSPGTVPFAKAWLREHQVVYHSFVRTENTRAKADLHYEVFIDDSAELMSAISSTANSLGILYSQPWNSKAAPMRRIFRVNQWSQIPAVLQRTGSENDSSSF